MNLDPVLVSVVYGLCAMLGWGIGDFLARKAIDDVGIINTMFWRSLIGLSLFVLILPFTCRSWILPAGKVGMAFLYSALYALGALFYLKGMSVGKLAVVSPISSAWGIAGPLVGIFLLGEALSALELVAVLSILIGIPLLSTRVSQLRYARMEKGASYAFASLVLWGMMAFFAKPLTEGMDPFLLSSLLLGMEMLFSFVLVLASRARLRVPRSVPLVGSGFVSALGLLGFIMGLKYGLVSLVVPVASAYPVVTIGLALLFLGERLEVNQWIGATLIIAGICLLPV